MFYLVKTAGLELALYSGEQSNGSREGFGTQFFMNGYKFTGQWQGNRANGKGRLEYTDGTFYEGTFRDNKFVEGILSFYTGAKFVGTFSDDERYRERFNDGSFIFTNGDMLKTTWKNGLPCSGSFISREGKVTKFVETEPAVFLDEEDPSRGKIIMANSSDIYEGGIKEKQPHGRGIIYSSFPHYEEAFYRAGKLDGFYVCNYIHGGYCYEGNFKNAERVGKWRYQTVKGFFYEGEANFKSGKVTFPYLNDDHFIGEVDIQFQSITLLSGTYHLADANGKYAKIQVQNVKNLNDIPEVRERKISSAELLKRFGKARVTNAEPILNGVQVYSYPDGSYFKGNFNYDFIYIHKKDLLNCYFPVNGKRASGARPTLAMADTLRFIRTKRLEEGELEAKDKPKVLSIGQMVEGELEGFGKRLVGREGIWMGRFHNGRLAGPGKFIDFTGQVYLGQFIDGQLEGPATVLLTNSDIVNCQFYKGLPNEKQVVIRKKNGLHYVGSSSGFKKHGHGELSYTNGYKYVGRFELGEIDTADGQGKIVTPEGTEFACLYTTVANRNIGILENVDNGDIYVYNSLNGSLKKAQ